MAEGIITRRGGVAGEPAPTFIEATGGTETTYTANSKNYKVHTFTSSGNFVVTQEGNGERAFIDYLVIAGGAGGGEWGSGASGGGGAGGYRTTLGTSGGNSNSELKVFLPVGTHPVIIGAGGATANRSRSFSGNHSSFLSIFSVGGGVGGGRNLDNSNREIPMSGGSGGGGYGGNVFFTTNGEPGIQNQGFSGGNGNGSDTAAAQQNGGGGGGAGQAGSNGTTVGGKGGDGLANTLRTGFSETRAGGGGGAKAQGSPGGAGGAGGGGAGGAATNGVAGAVNTGSGGGGGGNYSNATAGAGGSGIIIIRYEVA